MRILIFSTNYLPNIGGAEIAVKEITDRLGSPPASPCTGWCEASPNRGEKPDEKSGEGGLPQYEFDMIVPRLSRAVPKRERVGNVNVHRVGFGFALDKFFVDLMLFRAWRLHKKHHYDVAWSIMASQASVAAAAFKMMYRAAPLVLTLQEGDEEEHLKRYVFGSDFLYKIFIKPWHTLVFKVADHVTAISNYLAERAVQNGVPRENITLVPNGVDIERFHIAGKGLALRLPAEASAQAGSNAEKGETLRSDVRKRDALKLREDLNIKENEKVIITTSRLVKKNAVGDLIEAMQYLPENAKLLVVGDGPERSNLQQTTSNLQLGNRVIFQGGAGHEEIPEYLAISDVFARPSLSEGMGNSFVEAMAAGVPVVGTEVGGIPDFLEHEETGLFCEVNNPKSIAEQAERLLQDETLRQKITQNARVLVEERYSWDAIAEKMQKVFDCV